MKNRTTQNTFDLSHNLSPSCPAPHASTRRNKTGPALGALALAALVGLAPTAHAGVIGKVVTQGPGGYLYDIGSNGALTSGCPLVYQSNTNFSLIGLTRVGTQNSYWGITKSYSGSYYPKHVFSITNTGACGTTQSNWNTYFDEGDCAYDPSGVLWGMMSNGQLFKILAGVPVVQCTVNTPAATDASAMAFAPNGDLYVLSLGTGYLLKVNKTTGVVQMQLAVTGVSLASAIGGANAAMAFNPSVSTELWVIAPVFANGVISTQLMKLDTTTGAANTLGPTNIGSANTSLITGFVATGSTGGTSGFEQGTSGQGGIAGGTVYDHSIWHTYGGSGAVLVDGTIAHLGIHSARLPTSLGGMAQTIGLNTGVQRFDTWVRLSPTSAGSVELALESYMNLPEAVHGALVTINCSNATLSAGTGTATINVPRGQWFNVAIEADLAHHRCRALGAGQPLSGWLAWNAPVSGASGIQGMTIRSVNATGVNIDDVSLADITNPCIADVDDGSGSGTPDSGVTIDDLLYFLGAFSNGSAAADVDDGSGSGTPDDGVTIDDLLYYLQRFSNGC